jgi:hypothetical protein
MILRSVEGQIFTVVWKNGVTSNLRVEQRSVPFFDRLLLKIDMKHYELFTQRQSITSQKTLIINILFYICHSSPCCTFFQHSLSVLI